MPHRRRTRKIDANKSFVQTPSDATKIQPRHFPPVNRSTPPLTSYHSSDISPHPRPQEELEEIFDDELYQSTFESNGVLDLVCPVSRDDVDAVVAELAKGGLLNCKKYPDKLGRPQPWPKSGDERAFYKPLCFLMNRILGAYRGTALAATTHHYHDSLSFSVYDRSLLEGVDNAAPLKPDGVGSHIVITPGQRIHWHGVEVPFEVKDNWRKIIAQSATYARCLFAARESRWFALVIAFNHKTTTLRFCFFHRAGVMSSLELDLHKANDFRTFVRGLIGIASWPDASAAGMDISRDDRYFKLPHAGLYRIVEVFCDRRCVRGRATRVYCLHKVPGMSAPIPQQTTGPIVGRQTHAYNLRPRASQSRSPSPAHPSQQAYDAPLDVLVAPERVNREWMKIKPSPSTSYPLCFQVVPELRTLKSYPSSVVLKDSFLPDNRPLEQEVFEKVQGQFGIPNIGCSYIVQDGQRRPENSSRIIPHDAKYWPLFDPDTRETPLPEYRKHARTLYLSIGKPFVTAEGPTAKGPQQLLRGVLHGMLGHWNLFKAGWLHRDVSNGNIMLLSEPEERVPVPDFEASKTLHECVGMIIDGDQAIDWGGTREKAGRRSGTLPFLSMRIIKEWYNRQSARATHTAIDDLESFLWVLLYTLLEIINIRGQLLTDEISWSEIMASPDLIGQLGRRGIRQDVEIAFLSRRASPVFEVFTPLLLAWWEDAQLGELKVVANLARGEIHDDEMFEETKEMYAKYIEKGFEHLEALPATWDNLLPLV